MGTQPSQYISEPQGCTSSVVCCRVVCNWLRLCRGPPVISVEIYKFIFTKHVSFKVILYTSFIGFGNGSFGPQGPISLWLKMSYLRYRNSSNFEHLVQCVFCPVWVQNFVCNFKERLQLSCNRYREVSNIRRAKSQNWNDSHLVLKSSLPNPLKPGSAFIKRDQLDPWIKDQLRNALLSTILSLQLPNFVSCGRACPSHMTQNLVTKGTKLLIGECFLFDPWSMDQADLVW